jgi:hypothetical protein
MGCDGGSIPKRTELVKQKEKTEKADINQQLLSSWFNCALSKRHLREPIVSCPLGKLYNKDAVLEYLLDKNTYGDGDVICGHVKNMKDFVTLRLTKNPAYDNDDTTNNNTTTTSNSGTVVTNSGTGTMHNTATPTARFICPVTLKEMNGHYRFIYLASCGCVFAEAALKEVSEKTCMKCAKSFTDMDVVPINSKEDEEKLRDRMKSLRKKRKHDTTTTTNTTTKKNKGGTINAILPALAFDTDKISESKAIKSLYHGKKNAPTNPLFNGTFNRYATF